MRVVKLEKYYRLNEFEAAIVNADSELRTVYYLGGKGLLEGIEVRRETGIYGLICPEFTQREKDVRRARSFWEEWKRRVQKGNEQVRVPAGQNAKERYVRVLGEADMKGSLVRDLVGALIKYDEEKMNVIGSADFIDGEAIERAEQDGKDEFECAVEIARQMHPNYEAALTARDRALERLINQEFVPIRKTG